MGNKKKKRKLTDFGNALKALRIQKNYQQIDVAVAIDKSRQTIGAYEAGIKLPPIDIILQLAELFDVSAGSLVDLIPLPNASFTQVSREIRDAEEYTYYIERDPVGKALNKQSESYSRLLYYYQQLTKRDQQIMLDMMKAYVESSKNNPVKK